MWNSPLRTEGDEEQYEVFEITRDTPWKPRQFREEEEDPIVASTAIATTEFDSESKATIATQIVPGVYHYLIPEPHDENEPYYFDPEDAKRVTLGHATTMCIEKECTSDTPVDDLIAYLSYRELTRVRCLWRVLQRIFRDWRVRDTRWNSTLRTPFSPEHRGGSFWQPCLCPQIMAPYSPWQPTLKTQIQPYLAWAPLRVIQKTLELTTQLAKMAIRYPLQRHIRSRKVVITDPMFANCRCFGPG